MCLRTMYHVMVCDSRPRIATGDDPDEAIVNGYATPNPCGEDCDAYAANKDEGSDPYAVDDKEECDDHVGDDDEDENEDEGQENNIEERDSPSTRRGCDYGHRCCYMSATTLYCRNRQFCEMKQIYHVYVQRPYYEGFTKNKPLKKFLRRLHKWDDLPQIDKWINYHHIALPVTRQFAWVRERLLNKASQIYLILQEIKAAERHIRGLDHKLCLQLHENWVQLRRWSSECEPRKCQLQVLIAALKDKLQDVKSALADDRRTYVTLYRTLKASQNEDTDLYIFTTAYTTEEELMAQNGMIELT
ncbi:hypothetical protein B0H63DRAFT_561554, partial [Podospora didyma]